MGVWTDAPTIRRLTVKRRSYRKPIGEQMDEREARRNYADATGWLIYLPASRQPPSGYATYDVMEGWIGTILITEAACFDSHHAALRVLHAHYAHYKGAKVTPCIPGTTITHTGIDALSVQRKTAPHVE